MLQEGNISSADRIARVNFLLQNKANIRARDNSGKTPLFYAKKIELTEVASLLESNSLNVVQPDTSSVGQSKRSSDDAMEPKGTIDNTLKTINNPAAIYAISAASGMPIGIVKAGLQAHVKLELKKVEIALVGRGMTVSGAVEILESRELAAEIGADINQSPEIVQLAAKAFLEKQDVAQVTAVRAQRLNTDVSTQQNSPASSSPSAPSASPSSPRADSQINNGGPIFLPPVDT